MAVSVRAVTALSIVLGVSGFLLAEDAAPSRKEGKSARAAEARPVRLTKPWSALASLSDDQKQKINAIHRKAVADKKAIEEREKGEIMALLNDQQKAELTALEEKEAAGRKARAGQKPAAKSSAPAAPGEADTGGATAATADENER